MSRQLVLTFHGLGDPPPDVDDEDEAACWIPVDWFEEIIAALPDDDSVTVTFDDGLRSDAEVALPRLIDAGRQATFFVLAGRLGAAGHLDSGAVRKLVAEGMAVGSHGMHHRDWRQVSDDDLADEVAGSRRLLSDLTGTPVDGVAIPFGSYDRRVLDAVRHDYRTVFTSDGGPSRPGRWLVPRTTIRRDRPLSEWLEVVDRGARAVPSPVRAAKRWAKRRR